MHGVRRFENARPLSGTGRYQCAFAMAELMFDGMV